MAETKDVMIELKNIVVRFGDFEALHNINVDVRKGEFFTFLGPSGCGKTTTLRTITGFIEPVDGSVNVNGEDIIHVPIEKRNIGIVFQSYALFPTMTVYDNIAFGLKIQKLGKAEVDRKVREIARKVDLSDEKMQRDFGITTIYVTHDQEEALTLSDRIAVFNKGFIEQIGTPNEVYNHSKTEFVCNFIGDINRIDGEIAAQMRLDAAKHHFVRLERVRVNRPKDESELQLSGVIESREYYGLYIKYYIAVAGQTIKAIEKNDGINIYEPGEKVTVGIHPADLMSYDAPKA